MTTAYINRIATSVPPHDVHRPFIAFAEGMLPEGTTRSLFRRMVAHVGDRASLLISCNRSRARVGYGATQKTSMQRGASPVRRGACRPLRNSRRNWPCARLNKLGLTTEERERVTHVIVTSCTGLYAPGLDYDIVDHLGLNPSVERTMIGFMGCYAAINALKSAHHIVRSVPDAVVLILNLELCTLHLQETQELEQMLSFLLFADGCAACLVSGKPVGLGIDSFLALRIPETSHLITWKIREMGFDMHLSGKVPAEISKAMREVGGQITPGRNPLDIDLWAVHPGGRTVLDAVEKGLGLREDSLRPSREVLASFGNMSSATVMFVLESILRDAHAGQQGCAMSFGPGVTAETMLFHAA